MDKLLLVLVQYNHIMNWKLKLFTGLKIWTLSVADAADLNRFRRRQKNEVGFDLP
jgi:hypothetical protein